MLSKVSKDNRYYERGLVDVDYKRLDGNKNKSVVVKPKTDYEPIL